MDSCTGPSRGDFDRESDISRQFRLAMICPDLGISTCLLLSFEL